MPTPCDINPTLTLGAIRDSLLAEVLAVPATETVTIRRSIVWLLIGSIAEAIDRVDALFEGSAAADRLLQELAIARAEIARLELHATAHDLERVSVSPYRPMEKSPAEGRIKRRLTEGGEVIDISELLWREQMNRHRPTDGGAA